MTSSAIPPSSRPPKVSVFIPCYNYARHVGQAMRSVLEQTAPDLELIVVDNGSTDNSWEVIQSIQDPRVKTFRLEKNNGVCPAWVLGMEHCQGEWFSLLSADDYLAPLKHEIALAYLMSHPEVDAVAGCVEQVDVDGNRAPEPRWMEQIINEPRDLNSVDSWMMRHYVCIPTAIYRRSLCTAPADASNAVCDYHFHVRLLRRGCRFAQLQDVLAYYRVHGANTSLREQYTAPLQFAYSYAAHFLPYLRESGQEEHATEAITKLFELFYLQLRDSTQHDLGATMLCMLWPDWVAEHCASYDAVAAVEWETRQDGHHFHAVRAMVNDGFYKWRKEPSMAAPPGIVESSAPPKPERSKGWLREKGRRLERSVRHFVRGKPRT